MWGLFEIMALLAALGALPAAAVIGCRPAILFTAPLIGAVVGAFAAVGEFALGGSLTPWTVALGVLTSGAGAAVLWRRRRDRSPSAAWSAVPAKWGGLSVVVILIAAGWSLQALRVPIIGYDANAIWLIHAVAAYGGHHLLASTLESPAYRFTNPDYPPLVPAASALGFMVVGHVDLRLGVAVTSALSSCALAVVACGVASIGSAGASWRTEAGGLLAGAALCLAGFEFATPYGVSGYADLLWASAATAAVVYGLVLPRSRRHLASAWVGALAGALTKNEGMVMGVMLVALISLRYVPRAPSGATAGPWGRWGRWFMLASCLAVPMVIWPVLMLAHGIGSDFFALAPHALLPRVRPTIEGISTHLIVLPIAAVVSLVGMLTPGYGRRRLSLASPGWLWLATLVYALVLAGTYVIGTMPIQWWLNTSAARTTIFLQQVLATEIAVWVVLALGCERKRERPPRRDRAIADPAVGELELADPAPDAPALADRAGHWG
jgi:hypothetical protein